MPITYTPLRFPGGKTKLYDYVKPLVKECVGSNGVYVEPFAGGAGLAIKLLLKGDVSRIVINDLDRAVYCAWKSILYDETLIDFIQEAVLTIDEWKFNKYIVDNQDNYDDVMLGHASFYLNRTNISGIIKGGPIGGMAQSGKYGLEARFQKPGLISKIEAIREKKHNIELMSMDVLDLVVTKLTLLDSTQTFIYFDPPYVEKGPQLYENSFTRKDHENLAKLIRNLKMKWLVTYDDCELVRDLFSGEEIRELTIAYSAGKTKQGKEVAVLSSSILNHIGECCGKEN